MNRRPSFAFTLSIRPDCGLKSGRELVAWAERFIDRVGQPRHLFVGDGRSRTDLAGIAIFRAACSSGAGRPFPSMGR